MNILHESGFDETRKGESEKSADENLTRQPGGRKHTTRAQHFLQKPLRDMFALSRARGFL